MSQMTCPHCRNLVEIGAPSPGKLIQCPECYDYIELPRDEPYGSRPREEDPFAEDSPRRRPSNEMMAGHDPRDNPFKKTTEYQRQDDGDSDSSAWGWIVFILIFGVGNFILYKTTGIFLIPIRR